MTNPAAATPGPDHLATGDVVLSSSPKVTLGPAKAVVGAIAGAVVSAGPLVLEAIADGAVDLGEVWSIIGALLVGAGLVGGSVFVKSTKVTAN